MPQRELRSVPFGTPSRLTQSGPFRSGPERVWLKNAAVASSVFVTRASRNQLPSVNHSSEGLVDVPTMVSKNRFLKEQRVPVRDCILCLVKTSCKSSIASAEGE